MKLLRAFLNNFIINHSRFGKLKSTLEGHNINEVD